VGLEIHKQLNRFSHRLAPASMHIGSHKTKGNAFRRIWQKGFFHPKHFRQVLTSAWPLVLYWYVDREWRGSRVVQYKIVNTSRWSPNMSNLSLNRSSNFGQNTIFEEMNYCRNMYVSTTQTQAYLLTLLIMHNIIW